MPDDFTVLSGEELIGRLGELLGREAALQQAAVVARAEVRALQEEMMSRMREWRSCQAEVREVVNELRRRHGTDVTVEPL